MIKFSKYTVHTFLSPWWCKANDIFVPSWSIDYKYDDIWDYEQAMEKLEKNIKC